MAIEIRVGEDHWLAKNEVETGNITFGTNPILFVEISPERLNPRRRIEINGSKNEIIDFFSDILNKLL